MEERVAGYDLYSGSEHVVAFEETVEWSVDTLKSESFGHLVD